MKEQIYYEMKIFLIMKDPSIDRSKIIYIYIYITVFNSWFKRK